MTHVQTIPARRRAQLTKLAQIRNTIPDPFDRQSVAELFNRDDATLNDKDMEMIQTLADRYLIEVAA